jgi:hypothetical protein
MQTEHTHTHCGEDAEPCTSGCGTIALERNRYYTGKYMAARDFQDEQAYFVTHERLHNRLLHGWGILCGLEVFHHPDHNEGWTGSDCAKRWVVISPGLAIDCCGRELVLQDTLYYELHHLQPHQPPSSSETEVVMQSLEEDQVEAATTQDGEKSAETRRRRRFLLCLQYEEKLVECVPALYAEGACDPKRTEANRVREGVRLVEVDYRYHLHGHCWLAPRGGTEPTFYDDCMQADRKPLQPCLKPDCPCGDRVPLALIEYDPHDLDAGFTIDMLGRRELPPPPQVLTHIVHTSWEHGGSMKLSELLEHDGELTVRFDRNLYESGHDNLVDRGYGADSDAIGINDHTFTVYWHRSFEGGYTPVVLYSDEHPPSVKDGHTAVFTIDHDHLEGRANIGDSMLYITLKCDFILDCHGRPVDGNHLRGRLPTGDGTPGGDFVSWVWVDDDLPDLHEKPIRKEPAPRPIRRQRRIGTGD